MRSRAAVVDKLKLTDDQEFTGGRPNFAVALIRTVLGLSDIPKVSSQEESQRLAALSVQNHLNVRRVGVTYVLEIAYRSTDPEKAARIANAVADAYLLNQLETKYEATKRASVWLQERPGRGPPQSIGRSRESGAGLQGPEQHRRHWKSHFIERSSIARASIANWSLQPQIPRRNARKGGARRGAVLKSPEPNQAPLVPVP